MGVGYGIFWLPHHYSWHPPKVSFRKCRSTSGAISQLQDLPDIQPVRESLL
jgi:hypothetical protein